MKKRKLNKLLIAVSCIVVLLVGSASISFADAASTDVHMTKSATAISFSVTEKINMTADDENDPTKLTVDPLNVSNESGVGVISIDSIVANGTNGWTLKDQSTAWNTLPANAKQFGLVAGANNFDMATGAYTEAGTAEPGATNTTSFSGNTGIITGNAITDQQVANVVVTVSFVAAAEPGTPPADATVVDSPVMFYQAIESGAKDIVLDGEITVVFTDDFTGLNFYIKEGSNVTLDGDGYIIAVSNIYNNGILRLKNLQLREGCSLVNNGNVLYLENVQVNSAEELESSIINRSIMTIASCNLFCTFVNENGSIPEISGSQMSFDPRDYGYEGDNVEIYDTDHYIVY